MGRCRRQVWRMRRSMPPRADLTSLPDQLPRYLLAEGSAVSGLFAQRILSRFFGPG